MITLKTLPTATAQEVFDHIANHLLTQNQRSLNPDSPFSCVYRSPQGLKCAAGCLIADDEYKPEMETYRWHCLIEDGLVPVEHSGLICDLQDIHDFDLVEYWPSKLLRIAEQQGYTPWSILNPKEQSL